MYEERFGRCRKRGLVDVGREVWWVYGERFGGCRERGWVGV